MKIIAGPCQHESLEHSTMIAKHCKSVCDDLGIDYYFKASFDKANRTSANGKRGRGMQRTMDDFVQIKENLDVKILTDFHSVFEIHAWRGVDEWYNAIDVIQIPAFLCRQTDLITTACNSGKIVNIKKGQFLAPWDVEGILSKTKSANEVWITERGTSFGYNTLVVISLVYFTCLSTTTILLYLMLPTQYRNQVVKAQARVVTGILLLHFPAALLLWAWTTFS